MKIIRQEFLNFFNSKGHEIVPSDSLVPSSDPTLLFTSAGMVQFKAHFLQQIKLTYTRAASSQRCLRTTDIDQVGLTPRHLTLFEMLGNFSFGDYFKEEAIAWGWEFLTKNLNLDPKRLYPTVFKEDDEAFSMWKKFVPESKIKRMGEDTNFWTMGPTGPCGPCSEIYWDFKGGDGGDGPDESDRWMEVWNLVFTQFDRQEDGSLPPLPKKNIDTGMGLERLTSVVEGVDENFKTSLFKPIMGLGEDVFKYKRGKDPKKDISLKIFADHLRAVTLLAYDGILPSNEGRGYVMRRLLRRAVRQGSLFGLKEPFLYKGVPLIADLFKDTADELTKRVAAIEEIIKQEEGRFLETIETGSEKLSTLVFAAKKKKPPVVSGMDVFRLYDTYGFPPELTREMLAEEGIRFDEKEFEKAKNDAQSLAREGWKGSGEVDTTVFNKALKEAGPSQFKGYETLSLKSPVKAILKNGAFADQLASGEEGLLIFSETPFYPEGGGQVGDKGWLTNGKGQKSGDILDAQKPVPELIVHMVKALQPIKKGETLQVEVDPAHREPTKRHHTATHLLHAALRNILGKTVTQAGSLVEPNRLRFDFTYAKPLTPEQIRQIEDMVNNVVLKNLPVTPKVFSAKEAKKMGAMALFGEKYGDQVRCLLISDKDYTHFNDAFSLELCGGTHVNATGDIGTVKITMDTSLAAGVRRMEAVAGDRTIQRLRKMESIIKETSGALKATPEELSQRVQKLLDNQKKLEAQIRELKLKAAQGGGASESGPEINEVNGVPVAVKVIDGLDAKELRTLADQMRQKLKSGVVLVASTVEDEGKEKVSFVVTVTDDWKSKGFSAGAMAKTVADKIGGRGGGRPDFAQGGGQNKAALSDALKDLGSIVKA